MEANLYIDGGARGNPGPAGCGFLVTSSQGELLTSGSHFMPRETNNVAEYVALVRGVQAAAKLGVSELNIFSDSELVVRQIIGVYRVKNAGLKQLFEQAQRGLLRFERWQITHIPREQNREADRLVNLAIDQGLRGEQTPATDSPPADTGDHACSSPMKVQVDVSTATNPGPCPAGLQKGQRFVFTHVVPAGLCVAAMQSLIPAIMALQSGAGGTRVVKCPNAECDTVFTVSVVS